MRRSPASSLIDVDPNAPTAPSSCLARLKLPTTPFFTYVAYTAPHWPLHAHDEDIAKYKGRFDEGWDKLREKRLDKLVQLGILNKVWKLSPRDPTQPPWADAEHKAWLLRCMEVYAAQIDRMDQGIGRILGALEKSGQIDNTVVIFLADNGACAEDIPENVTIDEPTVIPHREGAGTDRDQVSVRTRSDAWQHHAASRSRR